MFKAITVIDYGDRIHYIAYNHSASASNQHNSCDKPMLLDDVFDDPTLLEGKMPGEIEALGRNNPHWQVCTLGKGSHKGQGLMIRELTADGNNFTDRIIQWHPGGGRHGAQSYWKVSSGKGGTVRIGPQFKP